MDAVENSDTINPAGWVAGTLRAAASLDGHHRWASIAAFSSPVNARGGYYALTGKCYTWPLGGGSVELEDSRLKLSERKM